MMGLCHVWTALRAVRKLRGEVAWSWKRVTAPVWVPYTLIGVAVAGILIGGRLKNGKW